MAKPDHIELRERRIVHRIPILYEDRSVLAIDKPRDWMLVPFSWQNTNRNLQAALTSSIAAGDFWARSRSLRFLRNVHRLDADTTGILLFVKHPGAARPFGDLFESRQMEKRYLAVVDGVPSKPEWRCTSAIAPDPREHGRMILDAGGKDAETAFRVLQTVNGRTLIEAHPFTGRTHQIRLHLLAAGYPIVGDTLYGKPSKEPLGLRAVELSYRDPFTGRPVHIRAGTAEFLKQFGFGGGSREKKPMPGPVRAGEKPSHAAKKLPGDS